jgi:anti-sigma factor RsiW
MRIDDAYRKLPEYLDGGLSGDERAEFERLFNEYPELHAARDLSERLDASLRAQEWIAPSPEFTRKVLLRVELEAGPQMPAPMSAGWWEIARVVMSVGALLLILILNGAKMLMWASDGLADAGAWVGSMTGMSLPVLHPVIVLGLIAPLLAGGYATCVLTGRCRLSS